MKKPSLLELRPTQFVLGMREVEYKVGLLRKFSKHERENFCRAHVIPVVTGPGGEPFLIDHHHFARACWETGTDEFRVKVIKDCRKLKEKEFWNFMVRKGWIYLHDQFGLGPHPPSALPTDIRFLADDPYRSLAWEAIHKGWIRKEDLPFFEFQWAALFRRNMDRPLHSKSDFRTALLSVRRLVFSDAAKGLPGFLRNKR
jgi:hypothetical protein